MSWGNAFDTEGQRAREFSLRSGCLEYGQGDGNTWSFVRADRRVDDGVWHRVGKDVRLYLDGDEVAAGNIDNSVAGNEVGLDFYAARFRTPPGDHDWF